MKSRFIFIKIFLIVICLLFVLLVPEVVFNIQNNKILDKVKTDKTDKIIVNNTNPESQLNLMEKFDLASACNGNTMSIMLETGKELSIYDAKRVSLRELQKIELFMESIDKIALSDISIIPQIVINSDNAFKSFIIWIGNITIGDNKYAFVLDEETEKIINFSAIDIDKNNTFLDEEIIRTKWADYIGFDTNKYEDIEEIDLITYIKEKYQDRYMDLTLILPLYFYSMSNQDVYNLKDNKFFKITYDFGGTSVVCFLITHSKGYYFIT